MESISVLVLVLVQALNRAGGIQERVLAEGVRQGVEAVSSGRAGGADLQGKPLTDWIEALADESRAEEAARVIEGLGTSAAGALSTAVLTHANPVVRSAAANSLGRIGGPGSVASLLKAIKDPTGSSP